MARAKKTDHQTIRVRVQNQYGSDLCWSGYDMEGDPLEVAKKFTQLAADFAGRTLELSWEDDRYDDSRSLYVYEKRLEYDAERDLRIGKTTAQRQAQEARERAEYERLSKKFAPKA